MTYALYPEVIERGFKIQADVSEVHNRISARAIIESENIRREMAWLVEKGPKAGLVLGCSSSVAPGVPLENIKALIEGFAHYRKQGGR